MSAGIGAALGTEYLTGGCSASTAAQDLWTRRLTPMDAAPGWSDLGHALEELRRTVRPKAGALHVALLPPLVQIRRIELPRLTEDELRRVLAREAGRYLLDPPAHPLVATWTRLGGRRSPVPYLAAFADAELVATIHTAAEQAGFRTTRVLPAHVAWEAGARRHAQAARRGRGHLVISDEDRIETLVFEDGWVRVCRRAGADDLPAILADEVRPGSVEEVASWLGVVAPEAVRQRIEDSVRLHGISPAGVSHNLPPFRSPAALAAVGAPLARSGELLPQPIRQERWRRERRLSHWLLAGAAAMVLLSAALELWGAHRELAALQAERRAMRPLVARAMELRETVDGVRARLQSLAAAEAGASRWTGIIANVAENLPSDAHLLSLRGAGDSLVLDGVAGRAAGTFESLRRAPGVAGVRAEAPIRQEAQDSAAPVERFSLGARLARNGAMDGAP
jgi:hypothetical protein